MDFFDNFPNYVSPLNPLGVLIGGLASGAIGGAIVAAKERKPIGVCATTGALLVAGWMLIGAHISSTVRDMSGGGIPGLLIGGVVGCGLAVVFAMRMPFGRPPGNGGKAPIVMTPELKAILDNIAREREEDAPPATKASGARHGGGRQV